MGCSTGSEPPTEHLLHGGTANRGQVVRVGDTVRRPLRGTSAATCALLEHLAEVGFDGAPRYLGTDERGREVLTYVEGHAVTPPVPGLGAGRRGAAQRRRACCGASTTRSRASTPRRTRGRARSRPGSAARLVTHNDPNLDNVVFRDGRAVALIDFDLASPGSRVWEVAAAARLWAPLRHDDDVDDARRGHGLARLRTFVDAYGLDEDERALLPDAVLANHDWLYGLVEDEAEHGHDAFAQYWREGAAERARRTRDWYVESRGLLVARAGLTGGRLSQGPFGGSTGACAAAYPRQRCPGRGGRRPRPGRGRGTG